MKGITPVVAVILLLLITISMVGFSFVWFSRISEIATNQTQSQMQAQLDQQAQKVRIDSATTTTASIRNVGSRSIALAQIAVFIDGGSRTCTWSPATDPLAVGSTATCTWSGAVCASGSSTIKASAPGNSDSVKCP